MNLKFALFSLCYGVTVCSAQLRQSRLSSVFSSFPDTARSEGHIYRDSLYTSAAHYSDNSIIIITPEHFKAEKTIDLIFWFHGWNNNIDSAIVRYGLSRQFEQTHLNAMLVLAETAKDAPDSYGGKLEQPNEFSNLVNDLMKKLKNINVTSTHCKVGNIVLAGHSGAYRIMANIVQNGNLPVQEVILFDALYAETPKFLRWLASDTAHRLINLYTDHGGTFDESKDMMRQLTEQNLAFDSTEESGLTPSLLIQNKILFIHTLHPHNDIIQNPDNFRLFLENSPFLKKIAVRPKR